MKCFKKVRQQAFWMIITFMLAASVHAETPLLDGVPVPAAAAFGLRKLRAAYDGAAIEVLRSSDKTTAKIGFKADGELDVPALLKFVGEGNGTVQTWYDQSGNGKNAEQPKAERQRIIVNAGKLVVFPGTQKPAHTQGGAGESFKGPVNPGIVRAVASVICPSVLKAPNKNSSVYWCAEDLFLFVTKDGFLFDRDIKSGGNIFDTGVVVTYVNPIGKEDRAAYVSGTLVGTMKTSKRGTDYHNLMQVAGITSVEGGHGDGFAGYMSEFLFFKQDITTADREKIEGNQAWYFGIEKSLPDTHPHKKSAPKQ